MIEVQLHNQTVLNALNNLQRRVADISPALLEIGEVLTESTKQRFISTSAPDGTDWADNAPATLDYKSGDTPLTGESGVLADAINFQLADSQTLEIGSPQEYAAMQQFGGTKAEFPWLWGDIPARPFLGISEQDEIDILEIISAHLEEAINP